MCLLACVRVWCVCVCGDVILTAPHPDMVLWVCEGLTLESRNRALRESIHIM